MFAPMRGAISPLCAQRFESEPGFSARNQASNRDDRFGQTRCLESNPPLAAGAGAITPARDTHPRALNMMWFAPLCQELVHEML